MSGRFNLLIAGCIGAAVLAAPACAAAGLGAVEHSSWTDIIKALWPIVVVIGGLVSAGIVLGLSLRFPTIAAFTSLKADVSQLKEDGKKHDRRIQTVEQHCAVAPSRQELQEDIYELGERLRGVEAEMGGIGKMLGTTNTYLHTLIERQISR